MVLNSVRPMLRAALQLAALLLLFEVAAQLLQLARIELIGAPLSQTTKDLLGLTLPFALINLPLILAERYAPGTADTRRYLGAAKLWTAFFIVAYWWSKLAVWTTAALHIHPLFTLQVQAGSILHTPVIALALLSYMWVFDFLYYWFHRAQHRFPALWRFHCVHHSIVGMNCLNSYHHITEEMLRFPVVTVPLTLLFAVDAPQLFLLSAFMAAWGQYIHSDTAVDLGPLGLVFMDNAHHRVHHSILEHHRDRNFAAVLPLWDRLFGTYAAPERGVMPPTGVTGVAPPRTVAEYLFMPFRKG